MRQDIGAMDVLMLLKGVCETATAFAHIDPQVVPRQLDLVRAAVSADAGERSRCAVGAPDARGHRARRNEASERGAGGELRVDRINAAPTGQPSVDRPVADAGSSR